VRLRSARFLGWAMTPASRRARGSSGRRLQFGAVGEGLEGLERHGPGAVLSSSFNPYDCASCCIMADMKRWEYAVVGLAMVNNRSNLTWNGPDGMREHQYRGLAPREFVEQLNQAGGAGWEAVGYTMAFGPLPAGVAGVSCLLKRSLE
jgi:hypothetical protein